MFIDIGCSNEREAKELGVRIGDPVVPDSAFGTLEKTIFRKDGGGEEKNLGRTTLACGKGFDDRIGAFIAAETVRRLKEIPHPNTVIGAATVQEEVGLRGARTSAALAAPDVCITLEVDIAGDAPGIESHEAPAKMGLGPSLITFDGSMIPNQPLKELVIRTAEECHIPLQLSQMRGGGTDAGAIHVHNVGCPSVVLERAHPAHPRARGHPEPRGRGPRHRAARRGVQAAGREDGGVVHGDLMDPRQRCVALDLETTGLIPGLDRIVEIGAVAFSRDGGVEAEYEALVDPGIPIPAAAARVSGITDDMVRGRPAVAEELPRFLAFLGDALPVAHNAAFDAGFLAADIARLGLVPAATPVVDTRALARAVLPGGRATRSTRSAATSASRAGPRIGR